MSATGERGTGNDMYRKLIVFIQAVAAVGILAIAAHNWTEYSTTELRIEMREEFASLRADMRSFRTDMQEEFRSFRDAMREEHAEMRKEHTAIRAEIHDVNKRLGRVEGEIRILTQERE